MSIGKLSKEEINFVIERLQSGEDLPDDFKYKLFPASQREYELTYSGKMPPQDILAGEDGVSGVPLQIDKTFGDISDNEWRNLIVFGDNLQLLKTINENIDPIIKDRVKGKIKLIYIDPPFATANEFQNKDGARAYSDKKKNADFLEFLRRRLIVAREILADDGSIYVHLDSKMSHYVKVVMDEVFGKQNFVNEIAWQYFMGGKATNAFGRKHDVILMYQKTSSRFFIKSKTRRYLDFKPSLTDDSLEAQSGRDEIGYFSIVATPDVWPIRGVFNMGGEYNASSVLAPHSQSYSAQSYHQVQSELLRSLAGFEVVGQALENSKSVVCHHEASLSPYYLSSSNQKIYLEIMRST